MSWEKTYSHNLACSIDLMAATDIWNRFGITISSYCGEALLREKPRNFGDRVLRVLGRALNKVERNHCYLAILADIERAEKTLAYLHAIKIPDELMEQLVEKHEAVKAAGSNDPQSGKAT